MKKYLIIIFSILYCYSLGAQDIPEIIPNTPEVKKLNSLIDYPVSHNTGLASIEIPIYEIKLSTETIPIKLVYNSSGFKPGILSEVGCGWVLVAEPYITRQVEGLPDEQHFYTNLHDFRSIKQEDLLAYYYGFNDGEPDQFSYNLGNNSGNFFIRRDFNNQSVKEFVTLPYSPIKITSDEKLASFSITNVNGTIFDFISAEYSDRLFKGSHFPYYSCYKAQTMTTTNQEKVTFKYSSQRRNITHNVKSESARLEVLDYNEARDNILIDLVCDAFDYMGRYNFIPTTGTSGICPPGGSEINHQYRVKYFHTAYPYYGSDPELSFYHYRKDKDNPLYKIGRSIESSPNGSSISTSFVSEINFPGGSIEFTYKRYSTVYPNDSFALNEIIIKDKAGVITNKVVLDIDYNTWKRNRLDKVRFLNGNNELDAQYKMEYEESFAADHNTHRTNPWGYLDNRQSGFAKPLPNVSMKIPYLPPYQRENDTINFSTNTNYDYNIIDPNSVYKGSMLKKMTYPTGGYSTFEYEPAKFFHPKQMNILYTGALRIKNIRNYKNTGDLAQKRSFTYGRNESGLGIATHFLTDEDFMTSEQTVYHEEIQVNSGSIWKRYNFYKLHILTTPILDNYLTSSVPIVYDQVIERILDKNGNSLGKTTYRYNYENIDEIKSRRIIEGSQFDRRILRPCFINRNRGWETGELIGVEQYKNSNGEELLVNKKEYYYTKNTKNKVQSLVMYPIEDPTYQPLIASGASLEMSIEDKIQYALGKKGPSGAYFATRYDTEFWTGAKTLYSEEETSYQDNGKAVTTYTKYEYNDKFLPVASITKTSKNEEYKVVNKYPMDYTDAISQKLVTKNMINNILDKSIYVDNIFIKSSGTKYKEENNLLVPSYSYTKTKEETKEVTYDKYDKFGNLLQYTAKDGTPVSYIWSYNYQYPIAEFKNLSYSDAASLVNSHFGITTEVLAQTNTPDENKIKTLAEKSNETTFISTYTYKPLVGIKSATHPSGITIYYEYDSFNRLRSIYQYGTSGNKEIIEKYEYSYENK